MLDDGAELAHDHGEFPTVQVFSQRGDVLVEDHLALLADAGGAVGRAVHIWDVVALRNGGDVGPYCAVHLRCAGAGRDEAGAVG